MTYTKEIWKEYPLGFVIEGFYKIEVSNLGNVRTFNSRNPNGINIKGSLQGGFNCLRVTFRKERKPADKLKLTEIQSKIDDCNLQIKNTKPKNPEILELRALRDDLIQQRVKLNLHINKKRAIYYCMLFHRAVAELFLESPESEDYQFIIHKDFDKTNNRAENLAWATQEKVTERYNKHPKVILREFKKQFKEEKTAIHNGKLTELEVLKIKTKLKKGKTLKEIAKRFGVSDMQIHRIKTGENWSHVKLLEDVVLEENKKK